MTKELKKKSIVSIMSEDISMISGQDILNILKNPNNYDRIISEYRESEGDPNKISEILIKNENIIDKEKLLFSTMLNIYEYLNSIKKGKQINGVLLGYSDFDKIDNFIEPIFSRYKKLIGNSDMNLYFMEYDEKNETFSRILVVNYNDFINEIDKKGYFSGKENTNTSVSNIDEELLKKLLSYNKKDSCKNLPYYVKDNLLSTLLMQVVVFNTLIKNKLENDEDISKITFVDATNIAKEFTIEGLFDELVIQLNKVSKYIDYDKFLLTVGKNVISELEHTIDLSIYNLIPSENNIYQKIPNDIKFKSLGEIKKDVELLNQIKERLGDLDIKLIDSNNDEEIYSTKKFNEDLKRIVNGKYISNTYQKIFEEAILSGIIKKENVPEELMKLIDFDKLINNYLKYNGGQAIPRLYDLNLISADKIFNMYINGKIKIKDIRSFDEKLKNEIKARLNEEELVQKYKDKEKDYGTYKNLYIELKLKGNDSKEILEDKIIDLLGEQMQEEDLKRLYVDRIIRSNKISEWGGESMLYDMISDNTLRPADVKSLMKADNRFEDKFKAILTGEKLSETEKKMLIFTTFDEENQKEKREEYLKLLEHPQNVLNPSKTLKKGERDEQIEPSKIWKTIYSLDEDYSYKVCSDGNVIATLPNIDNGAKVINKMFEQSNMVYGNTLYLVDENEFEKRKDEFITKDGSVKSDNLKTLRGKGIIGGVSYVKDFDKCLMRYFDADLTDSLQKKISQSDISINTGIDL